MSKIFSLRSATGTKVRGLLGVNIDITPRKLAEQERRRAHAALQSFLDHSVALVFLKDVAGRYLMVNRQFEKCFGVTREEVLGRTDRDIFPDQQANIFVENDRKVREAGS
jgi:PAS domain-containing protein